VPALEPVAQGLDHEDPTRRRGDAQGSLHLGSGGGVYAHGEKELPWTRRFGDFGVEDLHAADGVLWVALVRDPGDVVTEAEHQVREPHRHHLSRSICMCGRPH
jgi:hypothetical protein